MMALRTLVRLARVWLLKIRLAVQFRVLQILCAGLSVAPRRVGFALVVLLNVIRMPFRGVLQTAFTPLTMARLTKRPAFRFASWFSHLFPKAEIVALHGIGAHREAVELSDLRGAHVTSQPIALHIAKSLFELGEFKRARAVLDTVYAPAQMSMFPSVAHFKAQLDLVDGDIPAALANLNTATRGIEHIFRPHQNIAARYSMKYKAHQLDRLAGRFGRLYDVANFAGQRVTHVGRGELGANIYSIAIDAQKGLNRDLPPPISGKLAEFLGDLGISYDELRILPEEWSTQVGHLGMLDMLFRMRRLGWWSGKAIMVTQSALVANYAFQRLFKDEAYLFVAGKDIDLDLSDELTSLQRWKGMSFNAFELPSGEVVPWQEAGALAMRQWQEEVRSPPIRSRYDELFGSSETMNTAAASIKARWGMKPGDWYVCLHMRDAAHYGELDGTGQTHRNAKVKNYLDAVRHVTDQGGWVIKLGGPKSPKLPKMPRLFDYARSRDRSDVMDLHLIRNARFFIGTTSGLTNVAVSFGMPTALVNCITTDAQLWSNKVRFATKWIRLRDGSLIDQNQLTSTPWRWRVFSAELLGRYDGLLVDNGPDEILETVKEVEALALGKTEDYLRAFPGADATIDLWRSNLAFPHFYGDASPAMYAVRKFATFLKPRQLVAAAQPDAAPKETSQPLRAAE